MCGKIVNHLRPEVKSIPSFFIATDRNFLAVLDKGNLCSSPLHGLNVSIAYKGLDPNIVHMPKYVRHFLVIHIKAFE